MHHNVLARQHVAGDGELVCGASSAPLDAVIAGPGRRAPKAVDRVDLTHVPAVIGRERALDRRGGRNAAREQVEKWPARDSGW